MADVFDVSAYVLKKAGPMTAMKLQKLVYYAQAWSLVWDEEPLFDERIEAWANGPVSPDLYFEHQGQFTVSKAPKGDAKALTSDERETVDAILEHYGKKRAHWLSDLTHREDPWRNARRGLPDGVRSNRVISHASMAEFYGNL
jgi:uncharacterized phage-associated protein